MVKFAGEGGRLGKHAVTAEAGIWRLRLLSDIIPGAAVAVLGD